MISFRYTFAIGLFFSLGLAQDVLADDAKVFVRSDAQELLKVPYGESFGTLKKGAPVTIVQDKQDWVKVSVTGWVRRQSLSREKAATQGTVSSGPITLAKFIIEDSKKAKPDEPRKAILRLFVKNNTAKTVSSWRAILTVQDPSSNQVLFSTSVSDATANLKSGQTKEVKYYWDEWEQQARVLLGRSTSQMKMTLFRVEVQ